MMLSNDFKSELMISLSECTVVKENITKQFITKYILHDCCIWIQIHFVKGENQNLWNEVKTILYDDIITCKGKKKNIENCTTGSTCMCYDTNQTGMCCTQILKAAVNTTEHVDS